MSKLLALLLVAMMGAHLIRPLGLPGLRRRRDVWKVAAFALGAFSLIVVASHVTS